MAVPERLVKLSVLNDLCCPNCYVGHHELLTAVEYCQNTLHLNIKFDIEFLPFRLINLECLNDDLATQSKREFLTIKMGEEKYQRMEAVMLQWASEKNLTVSFDGPMSQSTRAHRLSRKAYKQGGQKLQIPVLRALYKAHLEFEKDIADYEVLAEIAEAEGVMSKDKAIEFLKSDELVAEVEKLCNQAREKGITGVPLTVIDGKWALSGGQSSDIFIQIFRKLAEAGNHTAYNSSQASTTTEPMKTVG